GIGLGAPYRGGYEMIGFVRGPDWKCPPDFPKNLPAVVRHRWPYTLREDHGAKKPAALIADLLRPFGLPPGAAVLDPFCGSDLGDRARRPLPGRLRDDRLRARAGLEVPARLPEEPPGRRPPPLALHAPRGPRREEARRPHCRLAPALRAPARRRRPRPLLRL